MGPVVFPPPPLSGFLTEVNQSQWITVRVFVCVCVYTRTHAHTYTHFAQKMNIGGDYVLFGWTESIDTSLINTKQPASAPTSCYFDTMLSQQKGPCFSEQLDLFRLSRLLQPLGSSIFSLFVLARWTLGLSSICQVKKVSLFVDSYRVSLWVHVYF